MSRIQVSGRCGRHGILAQSPRAAAAHRYRRHYLRLGPLALVALLPFGPIHIVAISALPVSERVGVAGRLRCLVLRLHRRRRRRLLRRGHGGTRRLTVRAAARVMPRLVRIVDAVAVLRAVDDAHVVVAHATRVLAVFIITRAAAVLHLGVTAVLSSRSVRQRWDRARGDGVGLGDQCLALWSGSATSLRSRRSQR